MATGGQCRSAMSKGYVYVPYVPYVPCLVARRVSASATLERIARCRTINPFERLTREAAYALVAIAQ